MKLLPIVLSLSAALLVSAAPAAQAEEGAPIIAKSMGKVITAPDLKQPLGPEWSTGKGKWDVADGLVTSVVIPEEKHIPVLHLKTGPTPLVAECDFKLNKGHTFLVGCDSAGKHVSRVVVSAKSLKVCDDSTEVKATKTPSTTLEEKKVEVKADEWHHIRVELVGDQMAARLGTTEVKGQAPWLATPKARWWFAAEDSTQVRNIKFTEAEAVSPAAAATPSAPAAK